MSALSLTVRKDPPNWITGSALKTLLSVLESALTAAAVQGSVQVSFLHEQSVLKRRPHLLSLIYQNSSRFNTPQAVAVIAAGKDPRNDQCGVILAMPTAEVKKFRDFMTANPLYEMNPPKKTEEVPSTPAVPEFDNDSIALFLDALKDVGGSVTWTTAKIVAARLFDGQTAILEAVIKLGFVRAENEICTITERGAAMMGILMEVSKPVLPVKDRFEELRESVKTCRQRLEDIRTTHGLTATTRTKLTIELEEANKQLGEAGKVVTAARDRLTAAEEQHRQRRAVVLTVEENLRALPADDGQLFQAQRELEAAELAYKKFVEI